MRSIVFGFRRALWIYLICRDVYLYEQISSRYGRITALLPPMVAALLLVLDRMWWREHAASLPRAVSVDDICAVECSQLVSHRESSKVRCCQE